MAGDWIKMRTNLFSHPKIVRISSEMCTDVFRVVGGLMSVWCLFDEHSTDGILEGYTCEIIDDRLRWPGFSKAMISIGWLIENKNSLELPEFSTHNGISAKRRAQDADRKREDRKEGKNVQKESASKTDKKRTREEKRRDINTDTNVSVCPDKKLKFTEGDLTTANYIWGKVLMLNPDNKPPNMNAWANTVRLMREQDKRNHKDICLLFAWANKHEFWRTNILSPEKLRKQYDRLTVALTDGKVTVMPKKSTFDNLKDTSWADGILLDQTS